MRGVGDDQGIIDFLVREFAALLEDGRPDDPAELEQAAATLLVPLELAGMPPELPEAFLGAIERRCDAPAAGLLAAIAVLAAEPVAGRARAAAERLARAGISSPAARHVGSSAVDEAVRLDEGDAELLLVLLRRSGRRKPQVALLGIEHRETGGALVECLLTPPLPAAEARAFVAGRTAMEGAPRPEPLSPDELAARTIAAARRAVDTGVALGHEATLALPVLSRALTGDPAGLPRPEVLPPWEDDDPELIVDRAEDEDRSFEIVERLGDELEEYATEAYPAGSGVWRPGTSSPLRCSSGRAATATGASAAGRATTSPSTCSTTSRARCPWTRRRSTPSPSA